MLKLQRQDTLKRLSKKRKKKITAKSTCNKIVSDEITDVQEKKAHLQESINDLIKDADKLRWKMIWNCLGDQMISKKLVKQKKRGRFIT